MLFLARVENFKGEKMEKSKNNKLKNLKLTSVFASILYVIFGILICALPETARTILVYTFGALLIMRGLVSMFNFFGYGFEPFGFIRGIVELTLGILVMCYAEWVAGTLFGVLFGIYFILKALLEIQESFDLSKAGVKIWWVNLLFALVTLILGIVLLINPFVGANAVMIYIGASLIVDGVLSLIAIIFVASKVKKMKKTVKDLVKTDKNEPLEADYVVDKDGNIK